MGKNKRKYLHICTYTFFNEPFIDFINKNFDSEEHLFLILTNTEKISPAKNVKKISKKISDLFFLIRESYKSEKIFLHGLVHREIVALLFLQPWLLRKCYWILLGEDLYLYETRKGFRSELYEMIRRPVIKNMKGIIAGFKEDYDLARKWYGARGEFYHSFLYPNFIYKDLIFSEERQKSGDIRIQIGHSADPRNNHFEMFDRLEGEKRADIEVMCPLVYGYNDYRGKVIARGKDIFGDRFKYQTDRLSINDYSNLLSNTDVAIFAHKGNLAGGNMIILLGMGKKVYARSDTSSWSFFKGIGLRLYDLETEFDGIIEKIPDDILSRNKKIIKEHYTENNLIDHWQAIFADKNQSRRKHGKQ